MDDTFPIEWQIGRLCDVVDFTRKPRSLTPVDLDVVPFLPMDLIPSQETWATEYISKSPHEILSGVYCEPGDILLAKITPCFENGKQGILSDIPFPFAYATTEVFPLKARPDRIDKFFLFSYLRMAEVRKSVSEKMEGTTGRQRVPKSVIENLEIPLPPLPEQRRIAAVLNTIQDAIAAQEDVIAAAKEFKRSLMHRLFTVGPGREPAPTKETLFGDVPAHWESVVLDHCAEVQTGLAKGRRYRPDEKTVMLPYLRVANVQDGYLDLSEIKTVEIRADEVDRYRLEPGDMLMTEGGDFDKLGRGFIWDGSIADCLHQNHVFAVRADRARLMPEFLAYLAQSAYGKAYFLSVAHRTTNLASINSTKLKALPVLLPSLEEQREVANILQVTDAKIAAEEDRLTALQALFKSMLHQLMTGQIRLLSDEGLPLA